MNKLLRIFAVGLLALLLAGCQQELYTGLTENEANQMVAALANANIAASKSSVDAGDSRSWQVDVDGGDIPSALNVLHAAGLPRPRLTNLGELFKKQGLVATPAEERIRYIYGVSQELSKTLLDIDGVVAARVQVVIPRNDPLSDKVRPSSAAVFIKYRPGIDLRVMAPMVKDLVAHSIEGLTYNNVSLFLTAAQVLPASKLAAAGWHGLFNVWGWLGALATLLVLLTLALLLFQGRGRLRKIVAPRGRGEHRPAEQPVSEGG
ncbi:type III secretion system inner membrane ring lipoprotein SctJ [Pandoraea sp.]|uniref:type III secretion system inner membrane ring lipoprotein SctJ n=1 Tax=Pandoraea sp. TaxID=1883445 RepID=UPI0011F4EAFD|nr:type III secretion inner membrane ring lipoprotein SctJ [Pandoraea sp.]MDE2288757.1 type III secretion inner membrane ring lipoprotein SctJ [Burkholderiales bacterium]MDE2608889.1 type III secretion inner membrane ring lipoprotein SctJ [Burkholderiales bacterium]TAL54271.1 MAG: EscJ/YscJ/HrcJ family type III secretion inner membrane ring protein [Pandoraea sp.]TAM17167.1 MAG: EscJ/YscJ/HrcJ family type III secretion inner membrane ring protein [Pandoraea sp.]